MFLIGLKITYYTAIQHTSVFSNMKTLRLYITAILLAFTAISSSHMQAQTLRDAGYHNIGRISPNGIVRDANSQSIGFFDNDGTVRNKASKVVGKVKGLQIYNTAGERIGYINTDGTVRNGESQILGYIDKSGKVTDADKNTIGYAQNVHYQWIACYFFFGFFN